MRKQTNQILILGKTVFWIFILVGAWKNTGRIEYLQTALL